MFIEIQKYLPFFLLFLSLESEESGLEFALSDIWPEVVSQFSFDEVSSSSADPFERELEKFAFKFGDLAVVLVEDTLGTEVATPVSLDSSGLPLLLGSSCPATEVWSPEFRFVNCCFFVEQQLRNGMESGEKGNDR